MDNTEGEYQKALIDEMLRDDPLMRSWYEEILRRKLADVWARTLREMGYHVPAKASEREVEPMSLVIGTVGTIDPTSVCEDAKCDQRGELMKDHRVTHKSKRTRKGLRGVCPHCQSWLHNEHDSSQLIAFQCLWRQVFGDKARTTPVNADTLARVAAQIGMGTITKWADRELLHTAVVAAVPKAVATASVPTATTTSAPPATPASTSGAAVTSPKGPAPDANGSASLLGTANSTVPGTALDPAAAAERKRKLRQALSGAKVMP